jgi:pyrroloquinoline quinone biosynthesis protein B
MKIHVLGSAAGGGFPQWNCNCSNCKGFRDGTLNAKARTQSSIAISIDGIDWILFNTSPDILTQLANFKAMQPARSIRDTGIGAIVLMDSQIDHTTGLLMLREGCPHELWCTDMVYQDLTTGFPVFNMLSHWNGGINRHTININDGVNNFSIAKFPTIQLCAIPLLSNAPPYSPHRGNPHPGDNIGILVKDLENEKTLFYAPGLGKIEEHLKPIMANADCLLVDGTLWQENEMIVAGVGDKLGATMGHLPQSGENGMLAFLDTLEKPRKILIHINNTNPILDEDSPQRKILSDHNVDVAFDGMDIEL